MLLRTRTFRGLLSLSLAIAVVGGVVSAAQQPAAADPRDDETLDWRSCGPPFECAVLDAPLVPDARGEDDDDGRPVRISLIRLPAADQNARIGSLLVNPGGPGGSGVDFVRFVGEFFPPELRASFDIVGFDPRGVLRSTPLRCFGSPVQWEPLFLPFPFPVTDEEEAQWVAADRYLQDACERRGGPIGSHMSTAQVARDMDLIRAAVGDRRLTYLGFSYGSFLGNVYANLFPRRVRSIVLDGVLDPVAWTTGDPGEQGLPFSTRLRSAEGATVALGQFFAACDAAGADCAFSGAAQARFDALAGALAQEPVLITDPATGEQFRFTYADLVASTLGALYSEFAWKDHAEFLAAIEAEVSPAALGKRLSRVREDLGLRNGNGPPYENFVEAFPGVACTDTVNPDDPAAWSAAADSVPGYFGRLWTWVTSVCSDWPFEDQNRYLGPWSAATAAPVLVVGNVGDPATNYAGAQRVAGLLPGARLLTYAGSGHTAFLGVSACIDTEVTRYLLSGALPAVGTTCDREFDPFAAQAVAGPAETAQNAAVAPALPAAVRAALGG